MKTSVLVAVFLTTFGTSNPAHAWWPVTMWSHRYGDATYQVCQGMATDVSGNVIMTGNFVGTLNFGGADLVSPASYDVFLVKLNGAGAHKWSHRFGVAGNQYAQAVAADASGNVYVAGYFEGTVNFGGGDLTSAGGADIFVAKFDAGGAHQWSKRFGDAGNQYCYSVATDASGNVYLPCIFEGSVDFGGGSLATAGSTDMALAKFNTAGVHQWSQRFGDSTTQYAYSAAADPSGNVYLGGWFLGTVNFGGATLTSSGGFDVCLAKFDPSGVHQWSRRWGSPDSQYLQCVTTDASSNVYLTGHYFGGINFGVGPMPSAGSDDIYLAKLSTAGLTLWSRRFGDAAPNQFGYALATDASENVYLAGYTQGTVNFGGGNLVDAGGDDAYLAKFNAAGVHQWSRRFGDASEQRAYAVATDSNENACLAGYFTGSVDFGVGAMTSAGIEDVFLAKFSAFAAEPIVASIADVRNDEGRVVRLKFARSHYDAAGSVTPVTTYEAYRRNDLLPLSDLSDAVGTGTRRQLLDSGWVYAGGVSAHGSNEYVMDASTDADSTITAGQHYSVFFIRAAPSLPLTYFDSPIDSGYSLDNLAPGRPSGLVYDAGGLRWDDSSADDFDYFSVYGSNAASFASATLVDYTIDTVMDVSASPYVFYFVTATDFSGNEGKPTMVNTLTGVGGTPKNHVLSISCYPNPFNPTTTIRYTVPSKGHVKVSVYDARGAHVATLINEEKDAGAFTQMWNGRDNAGRAVSSGVYFARVSHDSKAKSYKMLLLK